MKTIELQVEQQVSDSGQLVYEAYRLDGRSHNEHGPAFREWNSSGQLIYEVYCLNGQLHNEHGPAIRRWNDSGQLIREVYFLNGQEVAKERLTGESCSGKIVEIDGKRYQLKELT